MVASVPAFKFVKRGQKDRFDPPMKKLPRLLIFNGILFGAQHNFGGGIIWMIGRFDSIRKIFFKEPAEDFRIKIGKCAEDEEVLGPGDGYLGAGRIDGQ